MAKIKVIVVTPEPEYEEYEAEIDDSADDRAILASLMSDLKKMNNQFPDINANGQSINYYLALDRGLKIQPGSKIYIKTETSTVATILRKTGTPVTGST